MSDEQNGDGQTGAQGDAGQGEKPPVDDYTPPPGTPPEFAEFLKSKPPEDREQYDAFTVSLRQAAEREREANKTLRQELKALTARADGATKEELDALSEKLAVADRRIDFYRQATREGVPNVDLAWLAAREIGAFDKHGAPDFATLKAQYPELFPAKRKPAVQAGAGANGDSPTSGDMNAFIRRSAGRT
jgi:hypothetical protein